MTKSSNACQSFRITAKSLKLLGIICRFMYFLEKQFIFGWACHTLERGRWKFGLKRGISYFPGLSKGIRSNGP